jgi:hypothetical protein
MRISYIYYTILWMLSILIVGGLQHYIGGVASLDWDIISMVTGISTILIAVSDASK